MNFLVPGFLAIFSLSAIAATSGTPLAPPLLVNEGASGPVDRGLPIVASAKTGEFSVVWSGFSSLPRDLRFRTFSSIGSAQSGTVAVGQEDGSSQRPDQIAVNSAGNAVVVYLGKREPIANPLNPPPDAILAQRVSRDGLLLGVPILVAEQPPRFGIRSGRIGVPSVAMNEDGEFLVAWQETRFSGLSGVASLFSLQNSERIFARHFAADGTPIGTEKLVGQRLLGPHLEEFVRVASGGDGEFIVAYAAYPVSGVIGRESPAVFPFYGRIFGASGNADGLPFHFADGSPNLATTGDVDFDVAFSSGGDLVLAWAQSDERLAATSETIRLRRFNRRGVPVGEAVEVAVRGGDQ